MFCGASFGPNQACSSAIISLAWGFKPVQDELQHNFARMTDEADNNSNMGCSC